jgi:hypothetical protein
MTNLEKCFKSIVIPTLLPGFPARERQDRLERNGRNLVMPFSAWVLDALP